MIYVLNKKSIDVSIKNKGLEEELSEFFDFPVKEEHVKSPGEQLYPHWDV